MNTLGPIRESVESLKSTTPEKKPEVMKTLTLAEQLQMQSKKLKAAPHKKATGMTLAD